jgi:WS/DGAT/MGAT family acyltransferase
MWAIEGLSAGRIALLTKLHHCMIDGASGASQMAQLMDLSPDPDPGEPAPPWSPPPLPSAVGLAARSLGSRFVGPLELGRLALATTRGALRRRRAAREVVREGGGAWRDAPVPPTPWNRAIGAHRAVAYASVSLADLKRVKNAFGATVNDAVLAACALALRRYLAARDALPEAPLVCLVPVSLKSAREKREFSNKVSVMPVRLPTQLEDPEQIVRAVHRETADAKRVFEAIEGDLVGEWLQLVPPLLTSLGVQLYSQWRVADRLQLPFNLIVSNMMGPPVPLYFGGARVEAVYPMGPAGEGMGLNLTVLSNMGRVDLGVLACRECVPDPWEIADGFVAAVETLASAVAPGSRAAAARP